MRRGIVYVGGAGRHLMDQSAVLVADRIARSLRDKLPRDQPFSYRIRVETDAHILAPDIAIDIASIEALKNDAWESVIDVLEVKYLERFVKPFARLPPLARAVKSLWVLAKGMIKRGRAHRAARRGEVDPPESELGRLDQVQIVWLRLVTLASIGSVFYWLVVGAVAVLGVPAAFGIGMDDILSAFGNSTPEEGQVAANSLWMVLLIAFLLLLAAAGRKAVVEPLDQLATESFALLEYQLEDRCYLSAHNAILDAIGYATRRGYGSVDLLAFSLGAVLSTDAIFPRRERSRVWSAQQTVENWITIGYPYNLIRWSLPDYFDERLPSSVDFHRWINVLVQDDFLGTAFTKGDGRGIRLKCGDVRAPDISLPPLRPDRQVGSDRRDWFVPLRRAMNHNIYWDDEDARAPTCFAGIVVESGWTAELLADLKAPVGSPA